MGFMHIDSIGGSDEASDSACRSADAFGKELLKEVNLKSNCWNTPGYINVALIIKDVCLGQFYFEYSNTCQKAAKKALAKLQKEKNGWDKGHRESLTKLEKSLKLFINKDI